VIPTSTASKRATEERTSVAQKLPVSRVTEENSAAAKATVSPPKASKKRSHMVAVTPLKTRESQLPSFFWVGEAELD
jgi:hypothetical protein